MTARELISTEVIPLRTSANGMDALNLMDEYRVSHLPIVNNSDFLGLISEDDIFDLDDPEAPLGNYALSLSKPFIYQYQHIYDVIKVISELKLTLVPVLDEHNHYMGCISMKDIVRYFAGLTSIDHPGGIIVLEMNNNDLSMSQISQIIESNDARILSMYLSSPRDSTRIYVTLKINRQEIAPVLQTFNRYNYTIKASYNEAEDNSDLKDRYDGLMRYLNI